MSSGKTNRVLCGVLAAGIWLLATAPALADAWGASSGWVTGAVDPLWPSEDTVIWNTEVPEGWLLHAAAEVYHMHPPLTHEYNEDSELWDPNGIGLVSTGASTGCLAEVYGVTAYIAELPFTGVDMAHSAAHDIPNSYSDAAGLAQHDNLFWLHWTGDPDDQPDTGWVTVSLTGEWFLEGYSQPDDNWWADWFTYGEVYGPDPYSPDPNNPELIIYEVGNDYHRLDGPGYKYDEGLVHLEVDIEVLYEEAYAFRFWVDAESHAQAIPEPGTMVLLLASGLFALRRRSHARAADRRHA